MITLMTGAAGGQRGGEKGRTKGRTKGRWKGGGIILSRNKEDEEEVMGETEIQS